MSEKLTSTAQEQATTSPEAIEAAVLALASEFHDDWRKTRQQEDGSFEPRIKPTSDTTWIESHGIDQVDIANTAYGDLPADWQAENKEAATVVVDVLATHNGSVDLSDESVRNQVGTTIHDAWLSRNEWAKGGELDVSFDQLPQDEKAKDISQIEVAQRVFSSEQ